MWPRAARPRRRLVRLWCELLEVEQVGIYDNFFELGGHSLLATQLMSRLHDHLHVDFPLRPCLRRQPWRDWPHKLRLWLNLATVNWIVLKIY